MKNLQILKTNTNLKELEEFKSKNNKKMHLDCKIEDGFTGSTMKPEKLLNQINYEGNSKIQIEIKNIDEGNEQKSNEVNIPFMNCRKQQKRKSIQFLLNNVNKNATSKESSSKSCNIPSNVESGERSKNLNKSKFDINNSGSSNKESNSQFQLSIDKLSNSLGNSYCRLKDDIYKNKRSMSSFKDRSSSLNTIVKSNNNSGLKFFNEDLKKLFYDEDIIPVQKSFTEIFTNKNHKKSTISDKVIKKIDQYKLFNSINSESNKSYSGDENIKLISNNNIIGDFTLQKFISHNSSNYILKPNIISSSNSKSNSIKSPNFEYKLNNTYNYYFGENALKKKAKVTNYYSNNFTGCQIKPRTNLNLTNSNKQFSIVNKKYESLKILDLEQIEKSKPTNKNKLNNKDCSPDTKIKKTMQIVKKLKSTEIINSANKNKIIFGNISNHNKNDENLNANYDNYNKIQNILQKPSSKFNNENYDSNEITDSRNFYFKYSSDSFSNEISSVNSKYSNVLKSPSLNDQKTRSHKNLNCILDLNNNFSFSENKINNKQIVFPTFSLINKGKIYSRINRFIRKSYNNNKDFARTNNTVSCGENYNNVKNEKEYSVNSEISPDLISTTNDFNKSIKVNNILEKEAVVNNLNNNKIGKSLQINDSNLNNFTDFRAQMTTISNLNLNKDIDIENSTKNNNSTNKITHNNKIEDRFVNSQNQIPITTPINFNVHNSNYDNFSGPQIHNNIMQVDHLNKLNNVTSNFKEMNLSKNEISSYSNKFDLKPTINSFENSKNSLPLQPPNMNINKVIKSNIFGISGIVSEPRKIKELGIYLTEEETFIRFNKRGWICIYCTNFNYETRLECNRCKASKKTRLKFFDSYTNKYVETAEELTIYNLNSNNQSEIEDSLIKNKIDNNLSKLQITNNPIVNKDQNIYLNNTQISNNLYVPQIPQNYQSSNQVSNNNYNSHKTSSVNISFPTKFNNIPLNQLSQNKTTMNKYSDYSSNNLTMNNNNVSNYMGKGIESQNPYQNYLNVNQINYDNFVNPYHHHQQHQSQNQNFNYNNNYYGSNFSNIYNNQNNQINQYQPISNIDQNFNNVNYYANVNQNYQIQQPQPGNLNYNNNYSNYQMMYPNFQYLNQNIPNQYLTNPNPNTNINITQINNFSNSINIPKSTDLQQVFPLKNTFN